MRRRPLSKPLFTERLSFGMTPDMDRYLEELARTRSRQGKSVSKADLLREAVRLYLDQQADLTGSRKQIARSLEGKLEVLTGNVEALGQNLQTLQRQILAQIQEMRALQQAMQPLIAWIQARRPQQNR